MLTWVAGAAALRPGLAFLWLRSFRFVPGLVCLLGACPHRALRVAHPLARVRHAGESQLALVGALRSKPHRLRHFCKQDCTEFTVVVLSLHIRIGLRCTASEIVFVLPRLRRCCTQDSEVTFTFILIEKTADALFQCDRILCDFHRRAGTSNRRRLAKKRIEQMKDKALQNFDGHALA